MRKKKILILFFLISLLSSCNGPFYTKDPDHDLYFCNEAVHYFKDEKGFAYNNSAHSYNLNGDCKTCNWKKKYNDFSYSTNNEYHEAFVTHYNGTSSHIEIPNIQYNGCDITVVSISNTYVTHVKLTPTIQRISMYGSVNIEEVTNFTDGLNIGYQSFYNCQKFKGFDGKIGKIGVSSFRNCSISHIEFDESALRYIPAYAFYNSNLKSIELNDIIRVEESAFEGCSELESISFSPTKDNQTLYVESFAFKDCIKLGNVNFPKQSVVELSNQSFANCKSLRKIEIPICINTIMSEQFSGCENLEELDFEKINKIGTKMFNNTNIKSIRLKDNVVLAERAFEGGVEEVFVTSYGNEKVAYVEAGKEYYKYEPFSEFAFSSHSLKKVIFDGKLYHTVFNKNMFYCCSALESLTVPDGITELGESCFYGCYKLSSLVLPTSLQKIDMGCFYYTNKTKPGTPETHRVPTYEPVKIYYKGDKASWDKVTIERGVGGIGPDFNGNQVYVDFHKFDMFFYSESKPLDTTLQYWHFVDGVATSW